MSAAIEIRNLHVGFDTEDGTVQAVRGVDLTILPGRVLCLVGESGSGKSVTAHSIMRLLPDNAVISAGQIRFEGMDLARLALPRMQTIRGKAISMIFQEPMTSLNPVLRVGAQVEELLLRHLPLSRRQAKARVIELFEQVGITDAAARLRAYPYEMSGGMRQRVMIAMALACSPRAIIADEPTTALDVTIQAQVLDLIRRLVADTGTGLLLITHDLGVVSELADEVAVMYAGQLVETAPVADFFDGPLHPYSAALMRSVPGLDAEEEGERQELFAIPGTVPNLLHPTSGCAFRERCSHAFARCAREAPPLQPLPDGRSARCWLHAS